MVLETYFSDSEEVWVCKKAVVIIRDGSAISSA